MKGLQNRTMRDFRTIGGQYYRPIIFQSGSTSSTTISRFGIMHFFDVK